MPDAPDAQPDLAGFVRRHDPDRFLCTLFAPAPRRPALFALLAYNHEIARAREAATNPIAALIRLQWWREAVEEAAEGRPARRHEVAGPLHAALASGALDPRDLLALADAREMEMEEGGMPTRGAFGAYLRATAGGLATAMGRALGVEGAALPALQRIGACYGLAGVLRSLPAHAAQGRCLLPRDALEEAGLSAEAVVTEPARAAPLRRALAEEGGAMLRAALEVVLPRAALPVALSAVLARRDLARLAAGREVPAPRGLGDRLAVTWAGLRGRV
ncbi:squalene/phytoene synthase family protein [Falsiroseomonas sp. CW058]|uniref:squalene/phytoene synthase family protein n=1 Tax=Falsiroseomonas sp. CW058 TaxID=3388664 RepID=UPI003D311097